MRAFFLLKGICALTLLSSISGDNEFARRVLDDAPVATVACDLDRVITYANNSFMNLAQLEIDEIVGVRIDTVLNDFSNPDQMFPLLIGKQELRLRRANASIFWVRIAVREYDTPGGTTGWIIQLTNIDVQKKNFEKLKYRESIWRNALVASNHGVWDYHVPTNSRFYSDEWKSIRGIPADEDVFDTREAWEARLHPDEVNAVREHVNLHNDGKIPSFEFEYRERRRDGKWIWIFSRGRAVEWDEDGIPIRLTGTDVDITQMKEDEERRSLDAEQTYRRHLEELELARKAADAVSRQDPLTELPNRRVFAQRLEDLTSDHSDTPFAVLLCDLDEFKPINDTHGHIAGDNVICTVAERLLDVVPSKATLARLGGDEFGIILTGETSEDTREQAKLLGLNIIKTVAQPIEIGSFNVEVTASVGVSLYPEHGKSSGGLFRAADAAMYHVKQCCPGYWEFFDPAMDSEMTARAQYESDVRLAVKNEYFRPFFQPVINLNTGHLTGFEILARWPEAQQEDSGPDQFIPVIEQFGLMKSFTASMLRQALAIGQKWPAHIRLSLNISGAEVCDPELPDRLLSILSEFDFAPSRLEIEITESIPMNNMAAAKFVTSKLRSAGMRIVLDDFGTGYAGLNYLRELSFDGLKLDRSYIMVMLKCESSLKIVQSIMSLAKRFGLETTAEGIEDLDIHTTVQNFGCTNGQGFYYAKPMDASAATLLIQESNLLVT